jgi:hypothetical protein
MPFLNLTNYDIAIADMSDIKAQSFSRALSLEFIVI